ncbi:ATP-binding cassette domain-containing protein [Prauserella oleivorans]
MAADVASGSTVIVVDGVTKHYPGVRALTDAHLSIRAGEVRALLGRNGAGKSTLIRVVSGVERPDTGTVAVAGRSSATAVCAGRRSSASTRCTRS